MGKGSGRRNEDIKKVWDNWDTIFGKKDKETKDTTEQTKEENTQETQESTKTK